MHVTQTNTRVETQHIPRVYNSINTATLTLNFGTGWRWVMGFTPRPFYPRGKKPLVNTEQEAGWDPRLVWTLRRSVKIPCTCPESNYASPVVQLVAYSLCRLRCLGGESERGNRVIRAKISIVTAAEAVNGRRWWVLRYSADGRQNAMEALGEGNWQRKKRIIRRKPHPIATSYTTNPTCTRRLWQNPIHCKSSNII